MIFFICELIRNALHMVGNIFLSKADLFFVLIAQVLDATNFFWSRKIMWKMFFRLCLCTTIHIRLRFSSDPTWSSNWRFLALDVAILVVSFPSTHSIMLTFSHFLRLKVFVVRALNNILEFWYARSSPIFCGAFVF